jgi:glycosyltransferase involved in cell wall biosynthesis
MNPNTRKVALLIYNCPFHFPPTINAANILSEKGYEVHLIGLKNQDNWSQQLNKNVKTVYLGTMRTGLQGLLQYVKGVFSVRKYLRRNKINVLVGYDAKSVLPGYIATRFSKISWVFHQHDYWEFPKGPWEKFLWSTERKLTKYADTVSFPQTQRAEFFKKTAGLKQMPLIVYNGPRKNWLDNTVGQSDVVTQMRSRFKYVLIYQGGWSVYFGLERIFDALAICKTNTCLIMLGEEREHGVRDSYIKYLEQLGIEDKVYLAEKYIPYEALPGYTKYADAAIGKLTGEEDNAPFNDKFLIGAANKITEYVACGLPVLLQESGSNRSFLERYPIGIMTNTNDKVLFAAAIDDLMMDETKRKKIANNNKDIFLKELNFDNQFQKIIDVL